jgi:hypothetical protein
VAGEGRVFIDSDYSQVELVVLGYALEHQFGHGPHLADVINGGQEVHKLIAASVLGKPVGDVTTEERSSVKPISFGRPGGMGADRLRQIARASYGVELTREQVEDRINAYERLCPELKLFLEDEVKLGLIIAAAVGLTQAAYWEATGRYYDPENPAIRSPEGWLGGMLLKVLRDAEPRTNQGRPYTAEELDYFWGRAQHPPIAPEPALKSKLVGREADLRLWGAARDWAGRRPVFTLTGRLRAGATFCSSRNCIFQGPAADGAILGLWLVWRAGHKIVSFVHDQVVVESPADDRISERVAEIEGLMKRGMLMVVPGMKVNVETAITRSLNKKDVVREIPVGPGAASTPSTLPSGVDQSAA